MNSTLVLFCGGPAIYAGSPKPLQKLPNGETLIERYLSFIESSVSSDVVLLVDEAFEAAYCELLADFAFPGKLTILACPDESSTFIKLRTFLGSGYNSRPTVMFSYPDIFVKGHLDVPPDNDARLADHAFISYVPVVSRFPRLVVNPYDNAVQGISCHVSPLPANPLHVYGGHLLVRAGLMNSLVNIFLAEVPLPAPSLEFDMFFWLINTLRMQSMPIHGEWIQADSRREVEVLLGMP